MADHVHAVPETPQCLAVLHLHVEAVEHDARAGLAREVDGRVEVVEQVARSGDLR